MNPPSKPSTRWEFPAEAGANAAAQDALRDDRYLMEEAQAIAHVGSWVSGIDLDDRLAFSAECYRIFGLTPETELTLRAFLDRVHEADRPLVLRASRGALEQGTSYDVEHRIDRVDGTVRWVRQRAMVVRDPDGSPLRLIGVLQDVTDRRQAVEALRESEKRYRQIVESTSEGVWVLDAEAKTQFVNRQMAAMLGYGPDEIVARRFSDFLEESGKTRAAALEARLLGGAGERYDARLVRKDGSMLHASVQVNSLVDEHGALAGTLGMITDVGELRRAERARDQLAAIVECSDESIISTSPDGTILSWNRGAARFFGFAAEEALGQHVSIIIPPDRSHEVPRMLGSFGRGDRPKRFETTRRRKDGSLIDVQLTVSPILDSAENVTSVSFISRDVTESKRAERERMRLTEDLQRELLERVRTEEALHRTEEQLRQMQKMEAIGSLAGGIAHDFNNILSVILSYTDMLLSDLKPGDSMRADLQEIQNAGTRARDLTRQLLAFSRRQILQPKVVDLNAIVRGLERMLRRLVGEHVELSTQLDGHLGHVFVDPGQFEQVMLNLAANAGDAMPQGGALVIETSNVDVGEAFPATPVGAELGPYVVVTVTDNGIGMDEATRERMFEPFFTTKRGKGTGLGLATVFGIVKQSGGHVWVYSEPGCGTTMKLYFPRTDRIGERPRPSSFPPSGTSGSETVLLVEDDDSVRNVTRNILARQGYHVIEAGSPGEALLIFEQQGSKVHLLLTDLVMPRMSGKQLAERLVKIRPEMAVLFMSGYAADSIVRRGVLEPGVEFVQKPITPKIIAERVREVLDARYKP